MVYEPMNGSICVGFKNGKLNGNHVKGILAVTATVVDNIKARKH